MKNSIKRAIHGFIQVLVQAHMSVFTCLNWNKPLSGQNLFHDVCTYVYTAASNVRGLQAGSLLANSTRSMYNSIHLRMYKCTCTYYEILLCNTAIC